MNIETLLQSMSSTLIDINNRLTRMEQKLCPVPPTAEEKAKKDKEDPWVNLKEKFGPIYAKYRKLDGFNIHSDNDLMRAMIKYPKAICPKKFEAFALLEDIHLGLNARTSDLAYYEPSCIEQLAGLRLKEY